MCVEISCKQLLVLTVAEMKYNVKSNKTIDKEFLKKFVNELEQIIRSYMGIYIYNRKFVKAEFPSELNRGKWEKLFLYHNETESFSCKKEASYEIKQAMEFAQYIVLPFMHKGAINSALGRNAYKKRRVSEWIK